MQQRINMQRPTWAWLLETHITQQEEELIDGLCRELRPLQQDDVHSSDVIHLLDGNKDVQVIIDRLLEIKGITIDDVEEAFCAIENQEDFVGDECKDVNGLLGNAIFNNIYLLPFKRLGTSWTSKKLKDKNYKD